MLNLITKKVIIMKKHCLNRAIIALLLIGFASCDKDNNVELEEGIPVTKEIYCISELFTPQNVNFNCIGILITDKYHINEKGEYFKYGIRLNIPLLSGKESNFDHARLQDFEGVYTDIDEIDYSKKTWSIKESYIYHYDKDGKLIKKQKFDDNGQIIIKKTKIGSYILIDAACNEERIHIEYNGEDYLINSLDLNNSHRPRSNIPYDIDNLTFTKAYYISYVYTDKYNTDYQLCGLTLASPEPIGRLNLVFNLPIGASLPTTGTYTDFSTIKDFNERIEGHPNSLMSGFHTSTINYIVTCGCQYYDGWRSILGYFTNGTVNVESYTDDTYRIYGELYDVYGKKFSFDYAGIPIAG